MNLRGSAGTRLGEGLARRREAIAALDQDYEVVPLPEGFDPGAVRKDGRRCLRTGRRNRGRFVMSTGSPVTPATPSERVRGYCRVARELGRSSGQSGC